MNFVTIDFETANMKHNSACQIGIVKIADGIIVDKYCSYIYPPSLAFDENNIQIHGITPEKVKESPKFDELWLEIKDYFENDNIIIAHNALFDMTVLKACLEEYNIDMPNFKYICSMNMAMKLNPDCGRKLSVIADYYGYEFKHHDALEDAIACAYIVTSLLDHCGIDSIKHFILNKDINLVNRFPYGINVPKSYRPNKKVNYPEKISVKEIAPNVENFDEKHPFFNKNLVFTGELKHLSRKQAMQIVCDIGATIKSGVSKKVDYLIVGEQDISLVGDDGMSTKEERAYELISEGHNIKVINESDFLELIKSGGYNG